MISRIAQLFIIAPMFILCFTLIPGTSGAAQLDPASPGGVKVKPGVEALFSDHAELEHIKGKKVGLITNPTGVDHLFNSTIDLLHQYPECELVALFGPEHGIRGDFFGGAKVADAGEKNTGGQI